MAIDLQKDADPVKALYAVEHKITVW